MSDEWMNDWITDAESVIHLHCGSDGSSDEFNDWVHDLANALWRAVGSDACPTCRGQFGDRLWVCGANRDWVPCPDVWHRTERSEG